MSKLAILGRFIVRVSLSFVGLLLLLFPWAGGPSIKHRLEVTIVATAGVPRLLAAVISIAVCLVVSTIAVECLVRGFSAARRSWTSSRLLEEDSETDSDRH